MKSIVLILNFIKIMVNITSLRQVTEEIDVNEKGQDSSERDQDSNKEQCVIATIDFTDSRGLKYSMQAKIPTKHVDVNVLAKQVDNDVFN